ncbi:CAP domain-containing protein [Brevibacillus daliensis]|uniref:CAP domain-containing protein n=1 Tax=Brevibacillus daliensis TaxID=2892995 RepID=UPI001E3EC537|nr:CAP-associated domain-containing protein [Brevibacillus daliensis]
MKKSSWLAGLVTGSLLFLILQSSTTTNGGLGSHLTAFLIPVIAPSQYVSTGIKSNSEKSIVSISTPHALPTLQETAQNAFMKTVTPGHSSTIIPQSLNQKDTTSPIASKQPSSTDTKDEQHPALFSITLHMSEQDVLDKLGKPDRQEPSPLGYVWWVYQKNADRYVQVGFREGMVVDVFSNGPKASLTPDIKIGTSYDTVKRMQEPKKIVSFSYEDTFIEVTNDLEERILLMMKESPAILYLDKHNQQKITGIRLIDKLVLIQGGFYETKWSYTGKDPNFNPPPLSASDQSKINLAMEQQILDLTNVFRYRYQVPALKWSEGAATTARQHSYDMRTNNFFDHVSATTGQNPFDRLKENGVRYQRAGENIAAGFPDAIEAYQSWLNSLGHRKNVLEKEFKELGVGVSHDFYTQNFVTPLQ